ncbi:MAG: BREX system ATP-binding domain-containing protein [Candidatus Saliniplasma sp.]
METNSMCVQEDFDILVGREKELQELTAVLDEVESGSSQTIFVKGEPGVGKTSLLRELKSEASDRGFLILEGLCSDDDSSPYRPLQEAWADSGESSLERLGFEKREDEFEDKGMLDAFRNAAFYETTKKLKEVSMERPILMILEEMHWADQGTLNLFHYLADRLKDSPVLFIGTYCPGDAFPGSGFLDMKQQMSRKNLFTEIELRPLDIEETQYLVKVLTGSDTIPKEFVKWIHENTEGNPLFLKEGILQMRDEGALSSDEDSSFPEDGFEPPLLIQDVIEKRISRLSDGAREILQLGSVIGRQTPYDLLKNLFQGDELDLLDFIDELIENRLWEEDSENEFYFTHNMIKRTVYEGLGRWLERKNYHLRVADTVREFYHSDKEDMYHTLAHHYREAERFKESLRYYVKAGKKAEEVYSHEDAVDMYHEALDLTEQVSDGLYDRIWILERLAEAERLMGEYGSSRGHLYDALQLVSDLQEKQRIYRKIAETLQEQGEYERAYEIVQKLVSGGPETVESCRLMGIEGWSLMFMGKYEDALEVFKDQKDVAERLGDDGEIARAFHNVGTLYLRLGKYDESLDALSTAMEIREERDDTTGLCRTLNNIAGLNSFLGELEEALSQYRECLKLYRKMRNEPSEGKLLNNIGVIHYKRGELEEAAENLLKGLDIARKVNGKGSRCNSLINLGQVYMDMGENEMARKYIERGLDLSEKLEYVSGKLFARCILARLELEAGATDEAERLVDEVIELSYELGARRNEGIGKYLKGSVLREKEEYEKAEEQFEEALEIFDELGIVDFKGEALYEYGILNSRRGDTEKAIELIEQALDIFEERSMVLWADRCRAKLEEM